MLVIPKWNNGNFYWAPTVLQGGNRRGKPDRMSFVSFSFMMCVCAILLSIAAVRAIPDKVLSTHVICAIHHAVKVICRCTRERTIYTYIHT